MATSSLQRLRAHAICQTLFRPTTLRTAIRRLAFIQADPIRSPARAQDLILRHRVKLYRAGDLAQHYPALDIEEDVLYAYGFLPRTVWQLLHPRHARELPGLETKVLAIVRKFGTMHPRELESHLGRDRVVNAWGGYSKATTRALEDLHYRGLLRIARRENGIRVYEAAAQSSVDHALPFERLRKLVFIIAGVLAPAPEKSLQAMGARLRSSLLGPRNIMGSTSVILGELYRCGELQKQTVDGITYVWPACKRVPEEVPRVVRFLAPFDPLVWDRRRFEHLWRWPYRFEAYTPQAKRVRGYYALPLLWGDSIIGWANASVTNGALNVDVGFVGKRPTDKAFRLELEAELQRMHAFLNLSSATLSFAK
jgi:uncharacterized protein YcaQ